MILVVAYAQLFTLIWLNASTFGDSATIPITRWNEGRLEGRVLFGVLCPW